MLGAPSGVKLLPMTRPALACRAFFLSVAFTAGGCAYDRIDPPANESQTAPALSHPREPRKSADPPPPIREDLHQTKTQLITQADPAPATSSTLIDSTKEPHHPAEPHGTLIEPGVTTPLR